MPSQSRTKKSLLNSAVSMFFVAVQFLLGFYSRKIFLEYLGTEILGLNSTAVNILQFLNLTELGIGAAVSFSLYKPLHHDDRATICEIVSLQGHLYKRIADGIVVLSAVAMCFFPWIFSKMELPLWYAYTSFAVLLWGALLGYYVNYRQIVLSASQLDYKIQFATRPWYIIKILCQIAAMIYLTDPYVWWLVLEALFTTISAISLRIVTNREFPYLKNSADTFANLRQKYNLIFVKVKQLFIHKIAGFALFQASPLIIYAYMSLTAVALYGNYIVVTNGVKTICSAVFSSIGAGIGDLVAEGDKNRIIKVFRELFCLRFLTAAIFAWGFINLVQPFICVWIGPQYMLSTTAVVLLASLMFIDIVRNAVDLFINAYGLFSDVWAPITEATINLSLSILFGYFWGLNGILSGALVSLIVIVMIWKPYFLFTKGFRFPVIRYVLLMGKHLLIFAAIAIIMYFLLPNISINPAASWGSWFRYSIISITIFSILISTALILFRCGLGDFIERFRRK